jgi:hypothetical protein
MSFGNSASKVYLTRAQTRAMSIEEPIGDPFGGPAFGEFNDPVSATAGAAAVGLGGAFMQANAAGRAADTQAAATNAATAEQRRQYDLARGDSRSFLQTGQAANIKLRELLGLSGPQAGGQPVSGSFDTSNPVNYITQLYRTYLGRDPDQAGLQTWLEHTRNGMAPEEIERNIAGSVEAGMRGPQAPQPPRRRSNRHPVPVPSSRRSRQGISSMSRATNSGLARETRRSRTQRAPGAST